MGDPFKMDNSIYKINTLELQFNNENISVCEITLPISLDTFGHPIPCGLYDLKLGPLSENSDYCQSCGLNFYSCPGHFGHINLGYLCLNPLCFDVFVQLMNVFCGRCLRLKESDFCRFLFVCECKMFLKGYSNTNFIDLLNEVDCISGNEDNNIIINNFNTVKNNKKSRIGNIRKVGNNNHDTENLNASKKILLKYSMMDDLSNDNGENSNFDSASTDEHPTKKAKIDKYCESDSVEENKKLSSEMLETMTRISSYIDSLEPQRPLYKQHHDHVLQYLKVLSKKRYCPHCNITSTLYKKGKNKVVLKEGIVQMPSELREQLILIFKNDSELLNAMFRGFFVDMFFLDKLFVPPNKFRPIAFFDGKPYDCQVNSLYSRIIRINNVINSNSNSSSNNNSSNSSNNNSNNNINEVTRVNRNISINLDFDEKTSDSSDSSETTKTNKTNDSSHYTEKSTDHSEAAIIDKTLNTHEACQNYCTLQHHIFTLFDGSGGAEIGYKGVKQKFEKKDGLFRRNMMGKRVNHAARSVISPDPNIHTREIGVPYVFAENLTFPEIVTVSNYKKLQQMVINGPQYPGAKVLEIHDDMYKVPVTYNLYLLNEQKRTELSSKLLSSKMCVVHRHIEDKDIVLLNRQPTLHKPSIMAHVVKVLRGEKTIRMHYANCNSYNADFDGDEMNIHCLQNHLARAEAYMVMSNDHNYVSNTNGNPVRGLVQDHVVVCARICLKEEFMQREEYISYVSACVLAKRDTNNFLLYEGHNIKNIKNSNNVFDNDDSNNEDTIYSTNFNKKNIYSDDSDTSISSDGDTVKYFVDKPTILRPVILYTGKQIVTSILKSLNISIDHTSKSKTDTDPVIIRDGRLLSGTIDKSQIGPTKNSLVHVCGKKYGFSICNELLTSFGLVINKIMARQGYGARISDLLLVESGNQQRGFLCKEGTKAVKNTLLQSGFIKKCNNNKGGSVNDKETSVIDHSYSLSDPYFFVDGKSLEYYDSLVKQTMNKTTSSIYDRTISENQYVPFPFNNYSLMIKSGAKGSTVNLGQISGLLGQQELEGKRVPYLSSGTTLPCFESTKIAPQINGYIFGRFLDGISVAEYFFHCMAGREGLIDTAVKTARSGYLQRSLIKALEGLKVEYDYSVTNQGDIVQFLYGEDAFDTSKDEDNTKIKNIIEGMSNQIEYTTLDKKNKTLKNTRSSSDDSSNVSEEENSKNTSSISNSTENDNIKSHTINACDNDTNTISETNNSDDEDNNTTSESSYEESIEAVVENTYKSPSSSQQAKQNTQFEDKFGKYINTLLENKELCKNMVQPGEAVGIIAAQGVGEPSTQMTLNTFHLAGVGSKNVTLGIPRLAEILTIASKKIKTPYIKVDLSKPLKNKKQHDDDIDNNLIKKRGEQLVDMLKRITLKDITRKIYIEETGSLFSIVIYLDKKTDVVTVKKLICRLIDRKLRSSKVSIGIEIINQPDNTENSVKTHEEHSENDDSVDDSSDKDDINKKNRKNNNDISENDESEEIDSSEDGSDSEEYSTNKKKKSRKSSSISKDDEESNDSSNSNITSNTSKYDDNDNSTNTIIHTENNTNLYTLDLSKENKEKKLKKIIRINLDTKNDKVLLLPILESILPNIVIKEVENIKGAHTQENDLIIEGSQIENLVGILSNSELMNTYSNDIHNVNLSLGIEACRSVIVNEIKTVFNAYGITVNIRHLLLIADFMTKEGIYKPFNRYGLAHSQSILQKMSFESAFKFIKEGVLFNEKDTLQTPSANIIVGNAVNLGTDCGFILKENYSLNKI
ncbi:hypothetical protein EDEG_02328 [Edhazardia aedis USNM 41457]|uniref:DNA-directed RNA polymerase subunit n=1 Tax=Edhazardia aedis (strain USNM 41457) TaxID=1003232 RepID=J9DL48_EDHAE|nr:hypothetical protein EDEG_02328 [Edhazardia aedis USNM 41457]|eukprot:EJW03320.1 hypothetical protein EDEG_02328 [Edhazardia aedis USNM 41457]